MLLHRSSSRFRSTMWSRTSSAGCAAQRPRRVLLAHSPSPTTPCLWPPPACPHPLPGSLGLVSWATHTKSPTCSLRTVCVTCSRCSSRSSSGLWPALELHVGGPSQRRPSPPDLLPHQAYLAHPLVSPTSTHNNTLYSPGPSSSGGCWTLPSLAPLPGRRGGHWPEPGQGCCSPNPWKAGQPQLRWSRWREGGVSASFQGPLLLPSPPPHSLLLTAQRKPLLALQAPPQGAPPARCPHSASPGPLSQPASGPAPDPAGSVNTWRVEKNTDLPSSLMPGRLSCWPPSYVGLTHLGDLLQTSPGAPQPPSFWPSSRPPDQLPLDLPRPFLKLTTSTSLTAQPPSARHACSPALPPAPREFAPPSWLVCSEDQVPVEEGTEGWPGASTSRGHLFIGEETLRELPGLPCAHSPCPMPLLSPKGSFWSAQGQIQSHLAPFSLLCLPWEPLGHTSATAPPW